MDFGASINKVDSLQMIFFEKEKANYYYQIKKGEVKVFNISDAGKEFVQGMFTDGDSFGEPPLLGDFKYPASAAAIKPSKIYKLPKQKLFELLAYKPEICLKFTKVMSRRLHYKSMILKEISVHPPEHRILTLIDFLKKESGASSPFLVELTRQQIADLTGMRVETVIRTIKQLEQENELQVIDRKVYR